MMGSNNAKIMEAARLMFRVDNNELPEDICKLDDALASLDAHEQMGLQLAIKLMQSNPLRVALSDPDLILKFLSIAEDLGASVERRDDGSIVFHPNSQANQGAKTETLNGRLAEGTFKSEAVEYILAVIRAKTTKLGPSADDIGLEAMFYEVHAKYPGLTALQLKYAFDVAHDELLAGQAEMRGFAKRIAETGFVISKETIDALIGHLTDVQQRAVMDRAAEIARERGNAMKSEANAVEALVRLAQATGMPEGGMPIPWLQERSLIEEVEGGWRFKAAKPGMVH